MKTIKRLLAAGVSTLLIALSLITWQVFPAYADDEIVDAEQETVEEAVGIIISFSQQLDSHSDGSYIVVHANITGEIGEDYKAKVFLNGSEKNNQILNGNGEIDFRSFGIRKDNSYEVYAVVIDGNGDTVAESNHIGFSVVQQAKITKDDVTVSSTYTGEETGTVTVNGLNRIGYYLYGNPAETVSEGNVISDLGEGEYYVFAPAYIDGDTVYLRSTNNYKVTVGKTDRPKYTVSTTSSDYVNWSKTEVSLTQGLSDSIYVSATDDDHYISSVTWLPEDAEISWYKPTGEVYISNISGDVTLYAVAAEKPVPSSIAVTGTSFNKTGIYSESNPYIQTTFTVAVKDQFGNAVPETTVYYKTDERDLSYSTRKTDENGVATFVYSYGINREDGATTAGYNPLFSLDKSFETFVTGTQVNLVLQRRNDLITSGVLYEDQIVGSKPGEKDGKVTGLPEGIEVFNGTVHQNAIVEDSGEWVKPENGEVSGLTVGQHVLRYAEKVDTATNTFYFASNWADFFIPRIEHEVKIEEKTEEKAEEKTEEKAEEKIEEENTPVINQAEVVPKDKPTTNKPVQENDGTTVAPITGGTPADDTAAKTAETPAEDTAAKTAETLADDTAAKTAETPVEDTALETAETPAEDTAAKTAETPAEDTALETAETPVQPGNVAPPTFEVPTAPLTPVVPVAPAVLNAPAAPAVPAATVVPDVQGQTVGEIETQKAPETNNSGTGSEESDDESEDTDTPGEVTVIGNENAALAEGISGTAESLNESDVNAAFIIIPAVLIVAAAVTFFIIYRKKQSEK